MTQDSPYLTVDEAAEILRCHPVTLRALIRDNKIKATKLGRVYRIHRDEILPVAPEVPQMSDSGT